MRITDIKAVTFKYPSNIGTDANGHIHPCDEFWAEKTLIRIITDEGIEGLSIGGNAQVINTVVRPVLIGEDPLCREKIWRKLREKHRIIRRFLEWDLHAVDTALWDLAGKYCRLPVYKLLGGWQSKVKAYASTMCGDNMSGGLSSPQEYADFAIQCRERGYQGYKMHLWVSPMKNAPNWKKDLEACAMVKEAVGDSMKLMVDSSSSYNRIEALQFGRELQKLGFYWMEEPLCEAEIHNYKWLCNQLDIAICGPETPKDFETRGEWIIQDAADIHRCGAQDVGGITPLLKVIRTYETFGTPFDMHMSDPANLQVLGATRMSEFYERGLVHPFLDYDQAPAYLNKTFDPMDSNGYVQISDCPGIGLDVNLEYITNNIVD